MSVTTLLSMERSRGLMTQAIAQSGGALHTLPDELGRTVARRLAERLGPEPTRAALALVEPAVLARAVRELVEDVQGTPDPVWWESLALTPTPFAPSIDGEMLTAHPLDAIRSGADASVPLLTGWNRDEARFFRVASGAVDDAALEDAARGYDLPDSGLDVYRGNRPGTSPGDALAAIFGDWTFAIPAIRVAEARAESAVTWVYGSTTRGPLQPRLRRRSLRRTPLRVRHDSPGGRAPPDRRHALARRRPHRVRHLGPLRPRR